MSLVLTKKRSYNPYYYISLAIGMLFFPLKYIKKVKKDYIPLLKLINNLFVNNITASFLAIWYPLIFIGILPNVGAQQLMVFNIGSLIPSIIGIQVMPIIVVTLKNSSILKRIGATETKVNDLTTVLIFYFSIVSLYSSFMNIGLGMVFYHRGIDFAQIDFGEMFLGLIIGTIVGISFGMFLSGFLKTPNAALVIGIVIVVPGAFLTGQFLPPNMTSSWMGGYVNVVSFIFPQKIAGEFVQVAANQSNSIALDLKDAQLNGLIQQTPSSIFDTKTVESVLSTNVKNYSSLFREFSAKGASPDILSTFIVKLQHGEFALSTGITKIMAWSLAPTYIGGFIFATSKTFKWGVR